MISKVGIEFEGGWNGVRFEPPFPDVAIKYDGSVRAVSECQHYGEIVSEALRPQQGLEWAVAHVPHAVNISCGTHVHMSFKNKLHYASCVSRKYMDQLYAMLDNLANSPLGTAHPVFKTHLLRRLAGRNTYCGKRFSATNQMGDIYRSQSRYAGVNYCYSLHGTIEIRVLPGIADAALCEEVLKAVFTFTEDFIESNKFKKRIRFRR